MANERRRRIGGLAALASLTGTVPRAAGRVRRREEPDSHSHHHRAPAHIHERIDQRQTPRRLADTFEGDMNPEYTPLQGALGGDYYQADYHGGGDHAGNIVGSDLPTHSDYHSHSHSHADVFDSCLMVCYCDMVQRWGRPFAERQLAQGFAFEECEEDRDHCPEAEYEDCNEEDEGCVDGRRLGSTDQAHRMWNRDDYRGANGKLHIPYAVKDTAWFTSETLEVIASAIAHIEEATGVLQFVPRADQKEYIYFTHETRYESYCAANIGRQTNWHTSVYLGWCKEMRHRGNVIHEILHALGFWHEHSRPDRDDHVSIAWDNVRDSAKNNFAKASAVNSRGSPFDFASIMMYPARAFSTNYQDTILPVEELEEWEAMGQRAQLSRHDVEQLRLLYQCKSGPRGTHGGGLDALSKNELCSEDCPCWEHAMGECASDAECMGDLVCDVTPNPLPQPSYANQLPTTLPPGTTSFSCNDYCHPNCCYYANSIVRCPETCNSAPPYEPPTADEIPARMCQVGDGSGGTSTTSTTVATTTASTTTTITSTSTSTSTSTTATTTNNVGRWYSDWQIEECVQCDSPTCGHATTAFFDTQDECCTAGPLNYLDFESCMGATSSPTEAPTPTPKAPPAPLTPEPTDGPTASPTERLIQIGGDHWYYQWETNKCVKNCVGKSPCTHRGKRKGERGHKSVQDCCGSMMPNESVSACSDGDVRWYPAEGTCVNDGNASNSVKRLYSNQNKCCRRHFRREIISCLGANNWKNRRKDEEGADGEYVDEWAQ